MDKVKREYTKKRITELETNSIKINLRAYYDYQRERISLDNRMGLTKKLDLKKGVPERDPELLVYLAKRRDEVENEELILEKAITKQIKEHPVWIGFLQDVKGVGACLAAVILTEYDINIATTVSKLWSFAGLAPGKDKKKKGEKCCFNQFLRSKLCGVLGSSFLKCNSPYREFYDNMRHRLESEKWGMESKNPSNKDNTRAGHQHKAATRYMIKMFLKDLYVAWRTIEGLEVREPYQAEYLGKKH